MDKRGFIKLAGLGAGIVFSNSLNFRGVEAAAISISKAEAVSRVHFTPDKVGEFHFSCDVFCGDGHEDMMGTVIVKELESISGMGDVAIRAPWLHPASNS